MSEEQHPPSASMAVKQIKIKAISLGEQKKALQYSCQPMNCSFVRLVGNFKPYEGFKLVLFLSSVVQVK